MIFWSDIEELTQQREEERKRREEEARRKEEELRRKEEEARRIELQRQQEEEDKRSGVFFNHKNYWIEIPSGTFLMGSGENDKDASDNERPQHIVDLPYTYYLARYPVTNGEFVRFVRESGYKSQAANIDRLDHPVVNVSWRDVLAYCEWLQQNLQGLRVLKESGGRLGGGLKVRLPTESEWEKAARGNDGRIYPWGDEFDPNKCNSFGSGIGGTTPVGKYSLQGDSPYGVTDMSGNVWEWCQSKYKPYPYQADDGREAIDEGEGDRVVRGGSFFNYQRYMCGACRGYYHPDLRIDYLGFRVVVSPISRT